MVMTGLVMALVILQSVPPSLAGRMLKQTPTASVDCTGAPLDQCDFYFEGYKDAIPEFELKDNQGDYKVDPAPLRYSVSGFDAVSEVDSTGWAVVSSGPPVYHQFYLNGWPASVLKARTFNHPKPLKDFLGRCILLPIKSALLKFNGSTINLNPKDNHTIFAEDRRCVIFKTGSTEATSVDGADKNSPPAPMIYKPVDGSDGEKRPNLPGGSLPSRPPLGPEEPGVPLPDFFNPVKPNEGEAFAPEADSPEADSPVGEPAPDRFQVPLIPDLDPFAPSPTPSQPVPLFFPEDAAAPGPGFDGTDDPDMPMEDGSG